MKTLTSADVKTAEIERVSPQDSNTRIECWGPRLRRCGMAALLDTPYFKCARLNLASIVESMSVCGYNAPAIELGDVIQRIDPHHIRPAEVDDTRLGAPAKVKQLLGWKPEIMAQEMCHEMVAAEIRTVVLKAHGLQRSVSNE